MNTQRLKTLADFLSTYTPPRGHHFDLRMWYFKGRNDCGYSACAIGLAGTCIPEFQDEGFRIEVFAGAFMPMFDEKADWAAVRSFFGLEEEQAFHLFAWTRYRNQELTKPGEVADRIYALIREYERQQAMRVDVPPVQAPKPFEATQPVVHQPQLEESFA